MPRLQVLNGKRQGSTVDVGRGETVIGHRNTAPVCIDDPWVSWDHARLFFQGDSFWIEDLGSTNGTYVNCVRVKRERLNHEDIIFFGKTHVIFLVPEVNRAGSGSGTGVLDGKRSDFEIGVEQLATAAEQWNQPAASRPAPMPMRRGMPLGPRNDGNAPPTGSAAPAIPVPAHELGDPLRMAGFGGTTEESGRGDPWRAGPPVSADADPFASARAQAATDPFLDGGPEKRIRAFADTHLDQDALPEGTPARQRPAPPPGLEDFAIDGQDEADGAAIAPASAAEVSSLLDRGARDTDGPLDDLDALLGENAARTPDPNLYRVPGAGTRPRRSEAHTRPFDAASAARAVESDPGMRQQQPPPNRPRASAGSRAALPPLPPPQPSGTGRFQPGAPLPPNPASNARTQTLATPPPQAMPPQGTTPMMPPRSAAPISPYLPARSQASPPSAESSDESRPIAAGEVAFEAAKMQDEVRRLRAALDAARAADPEKVRVAVEGLRDQELGRQAREIAELRREIAEVRQELTHKQAELDDVTEDMIKKEDTIDELKRRVEALEGGRSPGAPPKSKAFVGGEGLGDLAF